MTIIQHEREKSRIGDLSQPQHHTSGGVDAAPASFKNAGELQGHIVGTGEEICRVNMGFTGLGVSFTEERESVGFGFWMKMPTKK